MPSSASTCPAEVPEPVCFLPPLVFVKTVSSIQLFQMKSRSQPAAGGHRAQCPVSEGFFGVQFWVLAHKRGWEMRGRRERCCAVRTQPSTQPRAGREHTRHCLPSSLLREWCYPQWAEPSQSVNNQDSPHHRQNHRPIDYSFSAETLPRSV